MSKSFFVHDMYMGTSMHAIFQALFVKISHPEQLEAVY